MKRILQILVVSLLLAGSMFAQSNPTATITGKVTSDGAGLPGVTVTAGSPNLQGERTTVTSAAGDYILPLLPPGVYMLRFELSGMQPVTRRATLTAARTDKIEVDLKPAAMTESITVTADTPMTAAIESTQVSTNFKADLVENLPVNRSITAVTLLAPGVNENGPAGNIIISGAMSFDSLYLVNGAIVNENLRGQPHGLFIEDAIQETTVMTGGISAEYGHFTGGVVSAITKSGGNELKGSFRANATNESWVSKSPLTVQQEDKINPVYEGTLGGPFLRDRIWFFGAGRYSETNEIRQTVPGLARQGDQDANGVQIKLNDPIPPITYPNGREITRLEGKLTGSITPRHNMILSYIDVKDIETNQTGQAIMDLDSLVREREQPNTLLALNYNGALSNRLFAEAQFSQKKFTFVGSGSPYFDIIKGTLLRDRARGTRFWSPTFRASPGGEHRDHDLYTVKGTYFLSTPRFGSHELKAGYEHFLEVRDVNNYQNGSDYRLSFAQSIVRGDRVFARVGNTGTSTRIGWLPILVLSEGSEYSTDSFYVTDRWNLGNHWTFNLGARYDKNDAISGDHSFQLAKDSAISPRVAAHYDIFANGRLVANASYSQYVGRLAEGAGNDVDPAGRSASFYWDYRGPAINNDVNAPTSSLIPNDQVVKTIMDWFFANGGHDRRPFRIPPSVPGVESTLDPNGLKSPNVKEYTIGLGGAIGTRGYARADLVMRNWDDFYTSIVNTGTGKVTDRFGTTFDHAIVTNSDIYDREYTGVQTQFQYRVFQQFNLGGTYTWSRLVGNVIGEDSGSGPLVGGNAERPEYRQQRWNFPMGYLPQDQRHRAKVWGSYDLATPVGIFNISVLQSYDAGTATSVDGSIDPSPYVTNPGYVSTLTSATYYFGGRGTLKTDMITRTDFALNYKLRLGSVEVFFQPEIINLFNEQGVVSFDQEVLTNIDSGSGLLPFNPFTTDPIECAQGNTPAQCTAAGAHFQRGPNFGQPNSESHYQTPRTFRFSVGVRF